MDVLEVKHWSVQISETRNETSTVQLVDLRWLEGLTQSHWSSLTTTCRFLPDLSLLEESWMDLAIIHSDSPLSFLETGAYSTTGTSY